MKYNISLSLEVDPEANFYGSDRTNTLSELEDLLYNSIYDIDDVIILSLEVEEDK
jgi:hypothetical protein